MAVYPGWFRVLDRFVLSPLLHVIQLTARQLHLDEENHCTLYSTVIVRSKNCHQLHLGRYCTGTGTVWSSLGGKTVTSCTWEGTGTR